MIKKILICFGFLSLLAVLYICFHKANTKVTVPAPLYTISQSKKNFSWVDRETFTNFYYIYSLSDDAYFTGNMYVNKNGEVLWSLPEPHLLVSAKDNEIIVTNGDNELIKYDNNGNVIYTVGPYRLSKYYKEFDVFKYYDSLGKINIAKLNDDGSVKFNISNIYDIVNITDTGIVVIEARTEGTLLVRYDLNGNKEWEKGPYTWINYIYPKNKETETTYFVAPEADGQKRLHQVDKDGNMTSSIRNYYLLINDLLVTKNNTMIYTAPESTSYFITILNNKMKPEWKSEGYTRIYDIKIYNDYFYYVVDKIGSVNNYLVKADLEGNIIYEKESPEKIDIKKIDDEGILILEKGMTVNHFIKYDNDGNTVFNVEGENFADEIFNEGNLFMLISTSDNENYSVRLYNIDGTVKIEKTDYNYITPVRLFPDGEMLFVYRDNNRLYLALTDKDGNFIINYRIIAKEDINNETIIYYLDNNVVKEFKTSYFYIQ